MPVFLWGDYIAGLSGPPSLRLRYSVVLLQLSSYGAEVQWSGILKGSSALVSPPVFGVDDPCEATL